jgi:uncharacterized repeat protein (TIGR01451 family)
MYTQETFDDGYAAADSSDKGAGGAGSALNLISYTGVNEHHYAMGIYKNGRYWIQIHYKGANTGLDVYHVAYVDIHSVNETLPASTKNAYVNNDHVNNGTSQSPVIVQKGDTITYEISFFNRRLPNAGSPLEFHPETTKPEKINFINGSFEIPSFSGGSTNVPQNQMPGWNTRPGNIIELQRPNGSTGFATSAPDGDQYAELNADVVGTLYQNCATVPGTKIYYEFYHSARQFGGKNGPDVMNFYLRPAGVTTGGLQKTCSDYWPNWGHYTGSYTVPTGQTLTEFSFESVSTAHGNTTVGNYLDAIRLYTSSYIELIKSNDAPDNKANVGDVVTYTIVMKNTGESDASNVKLSDTLPFGTEFMPGTVKIDGVATSNYSYNASSRTVNVNVGAGATASIGGRIKGDGSFSTDCADSYTVTYQIKVGNQEGGENTKFESQAKVTYEDRYDTAHDQLVNYSNVDEFGLGMYVTTTVTDIIPEGLNIISVCQNGIIGDDDRTITWIINSLYDEGMTTLTVVTEVQGTGQFDNVATVFPWFANAHDTTYTYHECNTVYTDITVAKTVTGHYASKTTPFTFTVYFMDADNNPLSAGKTFAYVGGVLPDTEAAPPANDTLTLISGGTATFTLMHGQTITIMDVPDDYQIKIVESSNDLYEVSYTDSGDPADPGDDEMVFKTVGTDERSFDFVNERKYVPGAGINDVSSVVAKMILLSLPLISLGAVISKIIKRSRWAR